MLRLVIPALFALLLAGVAVSAPTLPTRDEDPLPCVSCTGADPCKACKNCASCKHCKKDKKTCGMCKKKDKPKDQ